MSKMSKMSKAYSVSKLGLENPPPSTRTAFACGWSAARDAGLFDDGTQPYIEFLAEKLESGWQIKKIDGIWWLVDENEQIKFGGNTLRQMLANFVLGDYD